MGVMEQDLSQIYNGIVAGREPRLVQLTVQDSDFMAWLQHLEDQGALAGERARPGGKNSSLHLMSGA